MAMDKPRKQQRRGKRVRTYRPYAASKEKGVPTAVSDEPVRLNRFIARAGVCSRRDADLLISAGKVSVNGSVVQTLGVKVSAVDEVVVNGKRLVPARMVYLLLNKPTDTITTTSDERGRKSVLDLIAPSDLKKAGLFPVGRLDRHTSGALILTNDGMLAHRLMHPSYEIEKIYRVQVREALEDAHLDQLRNGVELDDGPATVDRIEVISGSSGKEVGLSLHEGRNRQIRRMFESIGREVHKLERIRYAGLSTTGLRKGKWRRLKTTEVVGLYKLVKL